MFSGNVLCPANGEANTPDWLEVFNVSLWRSFVQVSKERVQRRMWNESDERKRVGNSGG